MSESTGSVLDTLSVQECLDLISGGGIGRVSFSGSHGPTVLPVNYRMHQGAIVFRTRSGGVMDEDLRTGIKDLDMCIAFEIDSINETTRSGWSVLIQGPVRSIPRSAIAGTPLETWAGGERDHYLRIVPTQITGRRLRNL
ncbi:pyridoxamine 5'-phosphate oxidase family protein [Acrocarpospora catenulata]|uniref:pyridoxamine 5'-phosphate oxidase family protein n=1 Tax=Acrocarpospora catenulata TaxID=2836182 RepID=UPI001BDB2208|nr:pyridoxamine 5'-phosphate oxidase family protein [Acrocarpospora catenulata]